MNIQELGVWVNIGTLTAIIIFGYRLMRFVNSIEFKVELLWAWYNKENK